ncbi:lipopolysaccharide assembly protein LapA domain-containing protein [Pseudomonas vancouverensis]|uniref:lipopolysaccharide assembly protein LapA domain-containing protein n=1 Tax=Pseudomonas vancouverensis TaxID=95300 RepID=UPI003CFCD6FE
MRNLKRGLFGLVILFLVLMVLAFVLENQQPISLSLLGWVGPQLPISLVMVLVLLLGMVVGPIFAWVLGRISRASRRRSIRE